MLLSNIALSVYYMTAYHSDELIYMPNQRFKLFPLKPSNMRSVTKAGKCFIVIFALALLGFQLLVLGIPFIIDYTPILTTDLELDNEHVWYGNNFLMDFTRIFQYRLCDKCSLRSRSSFESPYDSHSVSWRDSVIGKANIHEG